MTQTFKLKRGQISFEKDRIIISDYAKFDKYSRLITNIFLFVLGVTNIRRFYLEGNQKLYYLWIILLVLILLISTITISKSAKSVILFKEIKSTQFRQRLNSNYLDIKLKNNRLRRISQIENIEELEEYILKHILAG